MFRQVEAHGAQVIPLRVGTCLVSLPGKPKEWAKVGQGACECVQFGQGGNCAHLAAVREWFNIQEPPPAIDDEYPRYSEWLEQRYAGREW